MVHEAPVPQWIIFFRIFVSLKNIRRSRLIWFPLSGRHKVFCWAYFKRNLSLWASWRYFGMKTDFFCDLHYIVYQFWLFEAKISVLRTMSWTLNVFQRNKNCVNNPLWPATATTVFKPLTFHHHRAFLFVLSQQY